MSLGHIHRVVKMETREEHTKRNQVYRSRNRIKVNGYYRRVRLEAKLDCFEHYSGGRMECSCCGEKIVEFLTLDHINGRDKRNYLDQIRGSDVYLFLRRRNFPKGYQVLCMNCNWGRRWNGTCPHENHINDNNLLVMTEIYKEDQK